MTWTTARTAALSVALVPGVIARQHLAGGDGPAFLAFFAQTVDDAVRQLAPPYVFFGPRNHSSTDRPEHFAHANGADSLISVWLAGDDLSRERRLLRAIGATLERRSVHVPDALSAEVARLPEGTVVLLPGQRQAIPGGLSPERRSG